jgi:hypothetical protein
MNDQERAGSSRPGDLGAEVVAEIRAREFRDVEVRELDRGFACAPLGVTQEVWSDPPIDNRGVACWRVHVRTRALKGFDGSPFQLRALSSLISRSALSALVRDANEPRRLLLASSLHVNAGNREWASRLLGLVVRLQLSEAEQFGRASAFLETGIVADVPDADSARRATLIDAGPVDATESSQFTDANPSDVADIADTLAALQDGWNLHAVRTPRGVIARVPCPDAWSGDEDILIEIEAKSHNRLGLGLAVSLSVPGWADVSDALAFAEAEIASGCRNDLLGSWSVEGVILTHRSFFPVFIVTKAVVLHVATAAARRALWLDLGPGIVRRDGLGLDQPTRRRLRRFPSQ